MMLAEMPLHVIMKQTAASAIQNSSFLMKLIPVLVSVPVCGVHLSSAYATESKLNAIYIVEEAVEEEAVIVVTVIVFTLQGGCDEGFNNRLSSVYRRFFRRFVLFVSFHALLFNNTLKNLAAIQS